LPEDEQKEIAESAKHSGGRYRKPSDKPHKPDLPLPRSLSEKAAYIRAWVATGERVNNACARFGMSPNDYRRASEVELFGNLELTKTMDDGLLSIAAAFNATKTPEQIPEIIEKARLKEAKKNNRQISAKGKTKPQLLMELLSSTYSDWKGAENNLAINSKTIPSDAKKLSEVIRLCKVIRKTIAFMIDKIEEEIEKCSAKTIAKKTC
jgi:hypothetical protein